ncbi:uncharacterized protein BX663DRAFT_524241 [Cokeromyces recurvatus]|uniref:uncharacterized protein n=1 Tax=Cokeromyces recurvatus TaxID=90255 RepID=UPI002220A118|nr:uncharacterized protein BX663DRAFT_524241 [Cokeromyces recurvatus]KAI7898644.1 hypothetical protein BX663DRAFT_524241 [Cokeromyces recurvatus]
MKSRVSGYLEYIHGLVDKAQDELKAYNNRRPSTKYSVYDIAFGVANYLPSWLYPPSLWREDPLTRRRHIAKVLRSIPLHVRPYSISIRNNVTRWAQESGHLFAQDYISSTIDEVTSLLQTAEDFVSAATDAELMDPIFLSTGYVALDEAVNQFISKNKVEFNSKLNSVNHRFNSIVNLSGHLRRSLESVRFDTIEQTKMVQHELFSGRVEQPLHHLSWHIRNELQSLYQELRQMPAVEDKEASRLLRKHTADSLRTEIHSLNNIKLAMQRSKSLFHKIWENASNELYQSPISFTYWVDVIAEVKEAAIQLGEGLSERYRKIQYKKCKCGY